MKRRHIIFVLALVMSGLHAVGAAEHGSIPGWPQWRGPFGNGSGIDAGVPLVDSVAEAEQVWIGDEDLPLFYGYAQSATSGCNTPVAADGRLFLYYRCGSERIPGLVQKPEVGAQSWKRYGLQRWAGDKIDYDLWLRRAQRVGADDVVVAVDLGTGKTLWRTVLPTRSAQIVGDWVSGVCVADDALLVETAQSGGLACLDTATGALRWWRGNPDRAVAKLLELHDARQAGKHGGRHHSTGNLAATQGVVISALGAFDIETGRRLRDGHGEPYRWPQAAEGLVLCGNRMIEAATGTVRWTLPGQPGNLRRNGKGSPAFTADRLVVGSFRTNDGRDLGLTCFTITPTGAELAWSRPAEFATGMGGPTIHGGHVYHCSPLTPAEMKTIGNKRCKRIACVDLATGAEVAVRYGTNAGMKPPATCTLEPFIASWAGDGRIFWQAKNQGHVLFRTQDQAGGWKLLGQNREVSMASGPSSILIEGRVYERGEGDYFTCWDYRRDRDAPLSSVRTWPVDPAAAAVGGRLAGLGSPFYYQRQAAIAALIDAAPSADERKQLFDLLAKGSMPAAEAAAAVVAAAGGQGTPSETGRVRELLAKAIADGTPARAAAVASVLQALDEQALTDELARILEEDTALPVLLPALLSRPALAEGGLAALLERGRDPAHRADVLAIAAAVPDGAVLAPQLDRLLACAPGEHRLDATLTLALLRVAPALDESGGRRLAAWLVEVLQHADRRAPDGRHALAVLGLLGAHAAPALPVICDPERLGSREAQGALRRIGPPAHAALAAAIPRVTDAKLAARLQSLLDTLSPKAGD